MEPSLQGARAYESFQFVRSGYFCVDSRDSRPEALVFNRIVSLKSSFKLPGGGRTNEMKDLLIELDSRMKMPLYEQICRFIKEEIRTGKIAPGEKLPSSRALAAQLSVSRSTVDLAYGQLTSEGYLDSVPWKGYFAGNVRELYQLGDLKRIQTQERQEQRPAFLWDFALNGIDEESFPVNIWRKISREVLLEENSGLFQLGEPQGEQSLREVIADYLHHARGVPVPAGSRLLWGREMITC